MLKNKKNIVVKFVIQSYFFSQCFFRNSFLIQKVQDSWKHQYALLDLYSIMSDYQIVNHRKFTHKALLIVQWCILVFRLNPIELLLTVKPYKYKHICTWKKKLTRENLCLQIQFCIYDLQDSQKSCLISILEESSFSKFKCSVF